MSPNTERITVEANSEQGRLFASVAADLREQTQDLLNEFTKISHTWRDGYKFAVGFTPFVLSETADGYRVLVPDLAAAKPRETMTEDISLPVALLDQQLRVTRAAGLPSMAVWYEMGFLTAPGWENAEILNLTRNPETDPESAMTGWIVEPYPPTEEVDWDALEPAVGWRVFQTNPAIIQASAVPDGHVVIVDKGEVMLIMRTEDMEPVAHGPL
ncbi:MAG: hypothetical protein ACTHXA_05265 [Gulosibacter sp.]|uniref:hypothetical protein n=1 Tax=Gulosibacter sp. TaxID=2817531 RepID=UPI003F93F375